MVLIASEELSGFCFFFQCKSITVLFHSSRGSDSFGYKNNSHRSTQMEQLMTAFPFFTEWNHFFCSHLCSHLKIFTCDALRRPEQIRSECFMLDACTQSEFMPWPISIFLYYNLKLAIEGAWDEDWRETSFSPYTTVCSYQFNTQWLCSCALSFFGEM